MADETPKRGAEGVDEQTKAEIEQAERQAWESRMQPMIETPWRLRANPEPRRALLYDGDTTDVFMPMGKVGMLAAAGGVGKTFAFLDLAYSLATGRMWLGKDRNSEGFKVDKAGAVLVALGEEDPEEIHRRLFWIARAGRKSTPGRQTRLTDESMDLAHQNLWPLSMCGINTSLVDRDGHPTPFMLKLLEQLHDKAPEPGWRAILLDPASRYMGSEAEKDNAAATAFVAALEQLTQVPGNPAVLVAHHTRKTDRSGGQVETSGARGASALTDGVRWVCTMGIPTEQGTDGKQQSKELVVLRHTKTNYGHWAEPRYLKRGKHGVLQVTDERPREQESGGSGNKRKDSFLDDSAF